MSWQRLLSFVAAAPEELSLMLDGALVPLVSKKASALCVMANGISELFGVLITLLAQVACLAYKKAWVARNRLLGLRVLLVELKSN